MVINSGGSRLNFVMNFMFVNSKVNFATQNCSLS